MWRTAIPRADGVVLGPLLHYSDPARQFNPSAALRTGFNLYANVRPCRSRPGLSLLRDPLDLVIVRENTEGFYADRSMYMGPGEFMPDPDSAFSIRKITAPEGRRVPRTAYETAMTKSEEPLVGQGWSVHVDLVGRRIIKRKNKWKKINNIHN